MRAEVMPRCHARQDPTRPSDGANLIDWWPFAISAACAGILMPLTIHVRGFGHDEPRGVQKLHAVATSRLGGIVIVIACAAPTRASRRGYGCTALCFALAEIGRAHV